MQALLDVILPVFLVIGFGYLMVWRGYFSEAGTDAIMAFTQNFAIPCLLFRAIAGLDLGQGFDFALLASFYIGAVVGFLAGFWGARLIFKRPWEDCVAIGFCTLFSNTVLLGLPISERAFGTDSLAPNYAIIALHAPFCYGLGFFMMEAIRASGKGPLASIRSFLRSMSRNGLLIGIAAGFLVNLSGLPLPVVFTDAVDMMARAALPAALFALGGVLVRYRPEGDMATIGMVCAISLILHPIITWVLGKSFGLTTEQFRAAVLTSAMAPGANTYIFANIFGVAKRVAASSVLAATACSVITLWIWLAILP